MKKISLAALMTLAMITSAASQALHCPICVGSNVALQYTGSSCICATITGATGPTGPQGPQGIAGPVGPQGPAMPASTCAIETTERWSGTAWTCTATKYLLAQ